MTYLKDSDVPIPKYEEFHNHHTLKNWIVLKANTNKEMGQLITAYEITDKNFIQEMTVKSNNCTYAKIFIDKYLDCQR